MIVTNFYKYSGAVDHNIQIYIDMVKFDSVEGFQGWVLMLFYILVIN